MTPWNKADDSPMISVKNIEKFFGTLHGLKQVSFRAETAEVVCVIGPSGSGKSTLLRILAGFEPASGRIELAGKVLMDSAKKTHIPPHKRNIGYMNHDSSLFKHLSVHGNLKYAAHRSRNNRSQSFTLDKVAGVLGLNNLLQKRPDQLSGGEVRRVGLGQTLLTNPILSLIHI